MNDTQKTQVDTCNELSVQSEKKEDESPMGIINQIISMADKGFELVFHEDTRKGFNYDYTQLKEISILFSCILNSCKAELIPAVEKIENFDDLNDELKNAGDILTRIINYSDAGFTQTDNENEDKIQELHYIFGAILNLSDVELRSYIPTPVECQ